MAIALAVALVLIGILVVTKSGGNDTAAPTTPPATAPTDAADSTPSGTTTAPSETTTTATTTTSATAPAGGAVDSTDLEQYLLSTDEIATTLRSPDMKVGPSTDEPITGGTFTPAHCAGSYSPIEASTYAGSGYTALAGQVVNQRSGADRQVIQAVVAFPDEATAKSFYDNQIESWRECRYVPMTADIGGDRSGGKLGFTVIMEDVAGALLFPDVTPGKPNRTCQRAMSVRGNLVVDLRACVSGERNVGNSGWTMARDITENIEGKR